MGKKVVTEVVPGASIVSSAIIQLRATSGGGKTTAMKHLMDMVGAKPIAMNERETKNEVYKGVIEIAEDTRVAVYVLGDYSPHRSAGGCDTIPKIERTIELVEKYGSKPHSLVVLEGLLISHSWGSLGEYIHPRWGERFVNAFLDTPADVCLQRVIERRAKRGEASEGDRLAKITKNVNEDHYRVQLCYERVVARGGVRVDIPHVTAKKAFYKLACETAARYCA